MTNLSSKCPLGKIIHLSGISRSSTNGRILEFRVSELTPDLSQDTVSPDTESPRPHLLDAQGGSAGICSSIPEEPGLLCSAFLKEDLLHEHRP